MRLGAIDVGTNSIRLVVAEATPEGRYRIIDDEKVVTRLGAGLEKSGRIGQEAMAASAAAVAQMRAIADGCGCRRLWAIGTSAARDAANSDELVQMIRERAGIELEVISAAEEARLAVRSVAHAFNLAAINAAVVDIGGGSTEIVLTANGLIEQVYPTKLGAVRLTDRFGTCEPTAPEQYDRMREFVLRELRQQVGRPPFPPQLMFGTGGTFTSLASVSMTRAGEASDGDGAQNVRGYEVRRPEVRHVIDAMRKLTVAERAAISGISADRAPIIVAGLVIAECVMKQLAVNVLRVHDRGIREGMLLEMIEEALPGSQSSLPGPGSSRVEVVERFGAACHYEQEHARQVSRLALRIFTQLVEQLGEQAGHGCEAQAPAWAAAEARDLLQVAALLHDVGYLINYTKHHKHSYQLIRHADLAGFTSRELEIVANIARYHRKAEPKNKHSNFARLSTPDRELVCKLAAISRLADGLARSHTRNIRDIVLRLSEQEAHFQVIAQRDPTVDLWGAQRKCSLFEKEFGVRTSFEWRQAQTG